MKKNAVAAIGSDGLVGSMVINIAPKKGSTVALAPGDTIKSFSKISTSNMLSTLNTTNENAALLTADLLKITTAINEGKGTLGMLITDNEMALNLKNTSLYLNKTSKSAFKTMDNLREIIESINYNESLVAVLLSDSIAALQLKTMIANLEKTSSEIETVISNINDVVLEAKSGDGSINYMLSDTLLVKNIDTTMRNLKEGSVLLNQNLEALKHNFLTRGYFKKQEKQKAKEEKQKK